MSNIDSALGAARQRYEVAGRAVHRWVKDVADALPDSLRETELGRRVEDARRRIGEMWNEARETWPDATTPAEQRPERIFAAANKMTIAYETTKRVSRILEQAVEDSTMWRVLYTVVPQARIAVDALNAVEDDIDRLLEWGREAAGTVATGAAIAGLAALALMAFAFGRGVS